MSVGVELGSVVGVFVSVGVEPGSVVGVCVSVGVELGSVVGVLVAVASSVAGKTGWNDWKVRIEAKSPVTKPCSGCP